MTSVRVATQADLPVLGRSLALAFAGDPVWEYLVGGQGPRWHRRGARLFSVDAGNRLRHGHVYVSEHSEGAALWAPPRRWRASTADSLRELVPALPLFGRNLVRAVRAWTVIEKAHPREPHWYLAILGTDPRHQGKGIGSALLEPVLALADANGEPAYLESSKLENVPFYRRHGFTEREPLVFPGGPPIVPMWREPR